MADSRTLLELDRARRAAMVAADVDTLETLFDDELVWIHATARTDTKAGLLEAIRSGASRYRRLEMSGQTVRVRGQTAVLIGEAEIDVEVRGELKQLRNRYTMVWVRGEDGWRLLNWQSTPLPTTP